MSPAAERCLRSQRPLINHATMSKARAPSAKASPPGRVRCWVTPKKVPAQERTRKRELATFARDFRGAVRETGLEHLNDLTREARVAQSLAR